MESKPTYKYRRERRLLTLIKKGLLPRVDSVRYPPSFNFSTPLSQSYAIQAVTRGPKIDTQYAAIRNSSAPPLFVWWREHCHNLAPLSPSASLMSLCQWPQFLHGHLFWCFSTFAIQLLFWQQTAVICQSRSISRQYTNTSHGLKWPKSAKKRGKLKLSKYLQF